MSKWAIIPGRIVSPLSATAGIFIICSSTYISCIIAQPCITNRCTIYIIGRVPITVSLDALDRDALIRILKEPKNSLIKQYTKLFELDGVGLEFTDDAVNAIADKALERKTGARGLRAIMEAVMLDLMYRIPSDKSISRCVIDKDIVEDNLKLDGDCVPEAYIEEKEAS